jgi:hypothetical protein
VKRIYDTSKSTAPLATITIDDLRESRKKHFRQNRIEFKRYVSVTSSDFIAAKLHQENDEGAV